MAIDETIEDLAILGLYPGGGVTDAALAAKYVVQQDPVTGALQVAGVDIPPAISLSFAAMQALDHTQYGSLLFLCNDYHSVGTTGGSLWQNDAAGNRVLLRSDPIRTTKAAAPSAVTYPGLRIFETDYGSYGAYKTSNGTDYILDRETVISKDNLTSNVLVLPTLASNGIADNAGTVRMGFASAHNILTVGTPAAQLYVTTTANGFTAGDWLTITNIPDTTHIDVSTTYAGKSGAPTLATVASASVVPMETIAIPALNLNSEITIELLIAATLTANAKNLAIKLGSTTFFAPTFTSSAVNGLYTNAIFKISNRNSKSAQIGSIGNLSPLGSITSSNSAPVTSTEATSGSLSLVLSWQPTTVNERMYFEKIVVSVRD